MALDTAWAVEWIDRAAALLDEARAALGELDRAIGDGDHGENVARGFLAASAALREQPQLPASPGAVLRLTARTLLSAVGGAAGPLYGTAFLTASDAVGDRPLLDSVALVQLLTAARDGVVLRGKAAVGEKTMVDAWTPAVDAATAAAASGASEARLLEAAAEAAARGASATESLTAGKGRASYLGERAVGHRDPGAQSTALLLRAAAGAAEAAEGAAPDATAPEQDGGSR